MRRVRKPFAVVLASALTALLLVVGPAAADERADSTPVVGGPALQRDGLVIDGQASPLPDPGAKTFVVADLDTGEVLAAKGAHVQLPPASTLKMLTALTVLSRLDPDDIYTAVDEDVSVIGSKVGLTSGSTYTIQQLLEGMFLTSGNDAATALANANGGLAATLKQMQAEARRVQAYRTVPRTPSGLDEEGQVSTAYDLALIARAGMARPDFAALARLSKSTFPKQGTADPDTRPTFEIWNQNDLVTGGFEGAIGVKSGFTTQAGRTFAAAAEREGRRLLVTLMGIEGNTYATGAAFLEWAFANADGLRPVGQLVDPKFEQQTDSAHVVQASAGEQAVPSSMSEDRPESRRASLQPALSIVTAAAWLLLAVLVRVQHRATYRRRSPLRQREHVDHQVG